MDKDVNIEGSLLIDGKPGKKGDVIVSRGAESTPAWISFSKSFEKSKSKNREDNKDDQENKSKGERLAEATVSEVTSRITGVLSEAFPMMTAAPYMRALRSLPGVNLTTSIIQKSGILSKKEKQQTPEQPEQQELLDQQQESFSVLEKILEHVVDIRKVIAGPLLKEGYVFEEGKGKGRGGFKSLATGRYVKEEEATAEPYARGRMGVLGKAKRGVKGAKDLAKKVASGEAIDSLKAGAGRLATGVATAGRAAVGVAAGGLKLGAILTALALFLPKDMKKVIGSIFEGLLQGLGFDKDTIEAIFTPFRILSDIAEVIKNVLGLAWDFVKWIFKTLGNIVDWFSSRDPSKVNAAEEVSKATGGTGHGEFTTGGEGAAESTPIPDTTPPPAGTPPPSKPPATGATVPPPGRAAEPTTTPTPPPVAERTSKTQPPPPATPAPPPAAPPVATPAAPVPRFPEKVGQDEAMKIAEWFHKPENASLSAQYDTLHERSRTIKKAIASTNALIRSETDPERIKEHKRILTQELEPGLEKTEKQRKEILGIAREAIRKDGSYADAQPAAPPPAPTPQTGSAAAAPSSETGSSPSSSGSSGSAGDAGVMSAGSEGGGGGAASTGPAAQLEPPEPATGQQIDQQSMAIESARDSAPGDVSTEVIENGSIAAGTVTEDTNLVPSPSAPRGDLDADIFFSALA